MDSISLFILRLSLAFLCIIGLFFLTGLSYVRKGHFAYRYRGKRLLEIWGPGFHYALPFFSVVSRNYPANPFSIRVRLTSKKGFEMRLYLVDPYRFFHTRKELKKTTKELSLLSPKERKEKAFRAFSSLGLTILWLLES